MNTLPPAPETPDALDRETRATCSGCAGFTVFCIITAAVVVVNVNQLLNIPSLAFGGGGELVPATPVYAGEINDDPLDFTDSEFAVPSEEAQQPPEIPLPLIEYIGEDAAVLLTGACQRVYSEQHKRVSVYRLATLAKFESGGDPDAKSPGGKYRGLLQISREHRAKLERMGLTWDDPEDMTYFGALMYLWHGDRPWSVRFRARRDYNKHGFAKLEAK